ncbi:hypothetical protein F4W66_25020 (plasmid) [Escherichia coli]|nr:hypothetical protein F4W66_25020 [Escherichia coli]
MKPDAIALSWKETVVNQHGLLHRRELERDRARRSTKNATKLDLLIIQTAARNPFSSNTGISISLLMRRRAYNLVM